MKRTILLSIALATAAMAQEKILVPLSQPGRPATVKVHLIEGSISVIGRSGSEVVVESQNPRLNISEDHNVVSVSAFLGHPSDVTIRVPVNISLDLKTVHGRGIEVTGVSGELEVENTNGKIILNNVSGSVIAHSLNGNVTATIDRVSPDKPMSFTSLNGRIEVTLPAGTQATIRARTNHGTIHSNFDFTTGGTAPALNFQTMNGDILIHRK